MSFRKGREPGKPGGSPPPRVRRGASRLRSRLRRHGLIRRPRPIRELVAFDGVRFTEGNAVSLYDNGRDGLAAMLAAVRAAETHIHLETYILRGDLAGRRFLAALTEKARDGVEVCLLYDAVGSRGLSEAVLEPLRAAGGQVSVFNPLLRFSPRFAPRRRDHRKILVLDGKIGFTGGLNIGDEYDKGPEDGDENWRDAHVRVEGPAVRDLQAVFLESWFRADAPDLPWRALLEGDPEHKGDDRCAVLPDGPTYRRRRMRALLVAALRNAARTVTLVTPYFAPGPRLKEALSRASKRGVEVELVIAGKTDHPVLRRAARSILPRLLAAGLRVFEYQHEMMHAKVGVFDSQWAIIGSSNLDRQSFEHSLEVNLIVDGGEIPRQLQARIERDVAQSVPLDDAALAARNVWDRLLDWLASFVLWFV